MNKDKPKIILGPYKKDNVGSISLLNTVFKNNIENDYEVIPFFTDREKGKTSLSKLNFTNINYFFKQNSNLKSLVKKHKPDIFHFSMHSYWSMEKSLAMLSLAKMFGAKKTIAHLHGGSFEMFWAEMNPVRKLIARRLFKNVDLIMVASSYWKDFFERNNFPNKIEIVNNPIDEEFLTKVENLNDMKRATNFLFVGSLGERKGTYDLLKVAEINKSMSLTLIGNSEKTGDFEKISNIIAKRKLSNIKLVQSDRLATDEKVKYFSESGCFVFPSYTENFPLVVIEAAASGMPIISTKVGALPEFFLHDQSILFVDSGNIAHINSAITEISINKSKAVKLGNAARQVYESKLSLPLIINQLNNAYKKVLNIC